jgi:hypothetical protein
LFQNRRRTLRNIIVVKVSHYYAKNNLLKTQLAPSTAIVDLLRCLEFLPTLLTRRMNPLENNNTLLLYYKSHATERRGPVISTPASLSVGPGQISARRPVILTSFSLFSSVPPSKTSTVP